MYNVIILLKGSDYMPLLLLVDFAVLLLIRFFIKIVITIFGWATNIFFGEIKDKNKVWFYIMILLSFDKRSTINFEKKDNEVSSNPLLGSSSNIKS